VDIKWVPGQCPVCFVFSSVSGQYANRTILPFDPFFVFGCTSTHTQIRGY
jgi:hypothetical protein